MSFEIVGETLELNCRRTERFRELGADRKYKHVSSFLYLFLNRHSHSAYLFFSKRLVSCIRYKVDVYGTATAVNKNDLVTEVAVIWDHSL